MRINKNGAFCLCSETVDFEGFEDVGGVVGFDQGGKPAGIMVQDGGELCETDVRLMGGAHAAEGERWIEAGGLVEEEVFEARQICSAAQEGGKREAFGDREEGLGVDGLAEAAGDQVENGLVPVRAAFIEEASDEGCAVAETLGEEGLAKGGPLNGRGQRTFTGHKGLTGHELLVPGQENFGRSFPELEDGDTCGGIVGIVLPDDMEEDIFVMWVAGMTVTKPVGGFPMEF